jgi:hypothetical protein
MYQAEYLRTTARSAVNLSSARFASCVRHCCFRYFSQRRARIPDRPSPAIRRSANPSILISRVHGNLACNRMAPIRVRYASLRQGDEQNQSGCQLGSVSHECPSLRSACDKVAQQFESGSSDPADQAGSVFLRAEKTGFIPVAWLRQKSDAVRFTSRQVVSVPELIAALRLHLPPGKERDRQSWSVQMWEPR